MLPVEWLVSGEWEVGDLLIYLEGEKRKPEKVGPFCELQMVLNISKWETRSQLSLSPTFVGLSPSELGLARGFLQHTLPSWCFPTEDRPTQILIIPNPIHQ